MERRERKGEMELSRDRRKEGGRDRLRGRERGREGKIERKRKSEGGERTRQN